MAKKSVAALGICLVLFAVYFGLNKEGMILMDGKEVPYHKVWGEEYILIDDILDMNYEINLVDSILTIRTDDITSNKNNPISIPQMDDIHIIVNGSQVHYKRIDDSFGLSINDLCLLDDKTVMELNEETPIGLASHIDAYYSTFNKLGYSPYRFKQNEDGSIVTLHAGSVVPSDLGNVEVDQVCEFVTKTEIQDYFSLKELVDGLDARYEIKNHVLTFSRTGGQKEFTISDVSSNYTVLGYPVLSVEFYAPGAKKISAYIDRGILKVNGKEFANAFGYLFEKMNMGIGTKVIIKGK